MHPCLETFDIIVLIFSALADDARAFRPALARLARTCRVFHEVALDLLWEEQTGMLPLLRCMPPDLWDVKPPGAVKPKLMLRRPILSEDWLRCQRMGARVKILRMGWIDYQMSPEVALALLISSPTDGILTNLHTLELPWTERPLFFCRPGPQLQEISIRISDAHYPPANLATSLLLAFPLMYPNVRKFTLIPTFEDSAVPVGIACEWVGLEALELRHKLNFGDLQHLSRRLPNLRDLDIQWEEDPGVGPIYPSEAHMLACSLPFPQLRNLIITINELIEPGSALAICDTLLRTLHMPKLNSIHILLETPSNTGSERASHSLLAYLGSHPSLRSIRLELPEVHRGGRRNQNKALCRRTVQPLLSCRHLIKFEWDCRDGFDLDNVDIAAMATAWPSLQWLKLSSSDGWSVPSRITLQGLATLLELCPHLDYLGIVIDATQVDVPARLIMVPLNNMLEYVSLGNSTIADAEAVATVLLHILPHLSSISTGPQTSRTERHVARWREVESILNAAAVERVND
ncbi:hypothetical protein PLICRDRAFT_693874 [Plicaturopsis crispa FD-325 SS-3]|nr:hypothetical protein PLICRDRAFT_693874 [Plicaturopsis crispa FD-325 SS-3]